MVRTFTSSVLEPYERGVEFGSVHAAEIAHTVQAYRRLFAAQASGPFHVSAWGRRAWEAISVRAAWAVDEIRGVADGAGVPVHEIAALNARTELLALADPIGVPECSTVVALPAGHPPVACQTWDWYTEMAPGWLCWTIPFPDGREVTTLTEYGVLAKVGVNSAGLGVLFNRLHHVSDASGEEDLGYPLHLLSRQILETATTTDEAVAVARAGKVTASSAVTVVDEAGAAVSLEMFPGGVGMAEPDGGVLVRTNNFVSAAGSDGCLAGTIGPGSEIRREKLLSAFEHQVPESPGEVLDAMHDHDDVGGVCVHPDPGLEPVLQHSTLATVVIDVAHRRLDVSAGGPCARPGAVTPRTRQSSASA